MSISKKVRFPHQQNSTKIDDELRKFMHKVSEVKNIAASGPLRAAIESSVSETLSFVSTQITNVLRAANLNDPIIIRNISRRHPFPLSEPINSLPIPDNIANFLATHYGLRDVSMLVTLKRDVFLRLPGMTDAIYFQTRLALLKVGLDFEQIIIERESMNGTRIL